MITREELEHTISGVYEMKEPTSINLCNEGNGQVKINIEVSDWYAMSHSYFTAGNSDLSVRVERDMPMLMMYFQKKGQAICTRLGKLPILEQTHSLNYLPNLYSNFQIPKGESSHHLAIKIDPFELISRLRESGFEDDFIKSILPNTHQPHLRGSKPMNAAIHQSMHDLLNNPYKGKLGKYYQENMIHNLLIHQLATFQDSKSGITGTRHSLLKRDIDLLHDIKNYLDQHYLEVYSLQELSRKFCINSFKLKHGFKALFNTSVMKYTENLKMHHARNLLVQKQASIFDIADTLGYQHYNNFSTAFKRKFGYSPGLAKAM